MKKIEKLISESLFIRHLSVIDPSFQGVNSHFVLLFNFNDNRKGLEILSSNCKSNFMIDRKNFLNQLIKSHKIMRKHSKNCSWSRRGLHNWLFARS